MDKTIAHLGFIQAIISRMGANSFLLKGWSVTLVAAIFVLSAKDANPRFVLLAYFPVVVFWALDGFFLHQEKLFRKLYEEVAAGRVHGAEFLGVGARSPRWPDEYSSALSMKMFLVQWLCGIAG